MSRFYIHAEKNVEFHLLPAIYVYRARQSMSMVFGKKPKTAYIEVGFRFLVFEVNITFYMR